MAPIGTKIFKRKKMAKQFGYTASILKDTNRLVASSQADWGTLRDGSYILLEGDDHFYKAVGTDNFFYVKDVEVRSEDTLFINDNTGVKITLNDILTFTTKYYHVKSAKVILTGNGYSKGDLLHVKGGVCSHNSLDGIDIPAELEVADTGSQGEIKALTVRNPGKYIELPSECELSGMSGNGVRAKLKVDVMDERMIEERSVKNITIKDDETTITLSHALPPRVKRGKISINKWEILLNVNYPGENKINTRYQVIRDFTPNLNLPLMRGDLYKNETVFNEAVSSLDEKIKKIYDKLDMEL